MFKTNLVHKVTKIIVFGRLFSLPQLQTFMCSEFEEAKISQNKQIPRLKRSFDNYFTISLSNILVVLINKYN